MKLSADDARGFRSYPYLNFKPVIAKEGDFHPWPFIPWFGWVLEFCEEHGKFIIDYSTYDVLTKKRYGIVLWIPWNWQERIKQFLGSFRSNRCG